MLTLKAHSSQCVFMALLLWAAFFLSGKKNIIKHLHLTSLKWFKKNCFVEIISLWCWPTSARTVHILGSTQSGSSTPEIKDGFIHYLVHFVGSFEKGDFLNYYDDYYFDPLPICTPPNTPPPPPPRLIVLTSGLLVQLKSFTSVSSLAESWCANRCAASFAVCQN